MSPELVFPDGRRVQLDDDVVVGRAPIAPESAPSARSISLSVPTVSKTHALIGYDASGVWLVDLHSSNGSEVLDDAGSSERAVPGQRLTVPAGSHIRVGTDTIITVDHTSAGVEDDQDRTSVIRPVTQAAPPPVAAPVAASVPDPTDPIDWSAVTDPDPVAPAIPEPAASAPSAAPRLPPVQPPAPQPPPPQPSQPPPPQPREPSAPSAPQTQVFSRVAGNPLAPTPDQQAGPSFVAGPGVDPAVASSADARSTAHLIGAIIILVWSAVGFATLRGWTPDAVLDAADGRLIGFFVLPERTALQFLEFFAFVRLPESLEFLAHGANIGPVIAVVTAIVALIIPKRGVRWVLVGLIAIPIFLLVGLLATLLSDFYDFFIDDIDRFITWFVLPTLGSLLLLWPSGRSTPAPTPPQDVFYAPGQAPAPPPPGAGAPPFS